MHAVRLPCAYDSATDAAEILPLTTNRKPEMSLAKTRPPRAIAMRPDVLAAGTSTARDIANESTAPTLAGVRDRL
jgi:hypothetical protein|tara:strand:+ start:3242 stop:3466 length:225 start_codon:yes stop_codon:yes gene_type:complete